MRDRKNEIIELSNQLSELLLTTDLGTIHNSLGNRKFLNELKKLKGILDTLDYYYNLFDR